MELKCGFRLHLRPAEGNKMSILQTTHQLSIHQNKTHREKSEIQIKQASNTFEESLKNS